MNDVFIDESFIKYNENGGLNSLWNIFNWQIFNIILNIKNEKEYSDHVDYLLSNLSGLIDLLEVLSFKFNISLPENLQMISQKFYRLDDKNQRILIYKNLKKSDNNFL